MKERADDKEINILQKALAAFKEQFSGQGDLEVLIPKSPQEKNRRPDALLRLRAGPGEVLYQAEIKPSFSHALRLYVVMKKDTLERPLILVTEYVNPEMADQLKKDGLEFIDTAGNAYIDRAPLFIFVKGNRPEDRTSPASRPRLFKTSGLKIIFALLGRSDLINATFREIASASGVSLGTVAGILAELKTRLYLVEDRKGNRQLIRKKDLFDGWVTAYPEQLRPKMLLGRYQGAHRWFDKAQKPAWAQWGGEVAASRLTNYLFPQIITVYLMRPRLDVFLLENKLRLDRNGNVEILQRFWPTDDRAQELETVHPILVYADLIASGNERNIETAKIIHDQHIDRYLRED